jgi:hypothetical protein
MMGWAGAGCTALGATAAGAQGTAVSLPRRRHDPPEQQPKDNHNGVNVNK